MYFPEASMLSFLRTPFHSPCHMTSLQLNSMVHVQILQRKLSTAMVTSLSNLISRAPIVRKDRRTQHPELRFRLVSCKLKTNVQQPRETLILTKVCGIKCCMNDAEVDETKQQ